MIRRGDSPTPSRIFSAFAVASEAQSSEQSPGEHPCNQCVAPCCTTVTLHEFEPQTFRDVDYLGYVVGFARIELGWLPSGAIEINYRAFCTHFDRRTAKCKIHGSDEQPLMCSEYDAHQCTYKSQFLENQQDQMVRVSAERYSSIAKLFAYDIKGTIVQRPTFDEVADVLKAPGNNSAVEYEKRPYGPTRQPPPLPASPAANEPISHQEISSSPCTNCSAYCCRSLIFPLPDPSTREEVSFYRYLTGFPGLEVALTPRGYVVQCFSRCRHLTPKNRCSLYEQPTRPVFCTAYDAWSCSFVPTYEHGTSLLRRFSADDWKAVESMFRYGEDGAVTSIPVYSDVVKAMGSQAG